MERLVYTNAAYNARHMAQIKALSRTDKELLEKGLKKRRDTLRILIMELPIELSEQLALECTSVLRRNLRTVEANLEKYFSY